MSTTTPPATQPPAWHTLAAQIEAELQADIAAYAEEVCDMVERSFTMGRIAALVWPATTLLEYRVALQRARLDLNLYTLKT